MFGCYQFQNLTCQFLDRLKTNYDRFDAFISACCLAGGFPPRPHHISSGFTGSTSGYDGSSSAAGTSGSAAGSSSDGAGPGQWHGLCNSASASPPEAPQSQGGGQLAVLRNPVTLMDRDSNTIVCLFGWQYHFISMLYGMWLLYSCGRGI